MGNDNTDAYMAWSGFVGSLTALVRAGVIDLETMERMLEMVPKPDILGTEPAELLR